MKVYSFLLLFTLISVLSFAQNQPKIDSLEALLKTNLNDKEKVDVWNGLAICYQNIDFDKNAQYTKESIRLAKKINYDEGMVDALVSKGFATILIGEYNKAKGILEEALSISKAVSYKKGKAKSWNGIGTINLKLGDFDSAKKYFEQSLEVFDKIGGEKDITIVLSNIGNVYNFKAKYDSALEFYSKSLMKAKKNNYQEQIATCYNNIGSVYIKKGNLEKALDYHTKALEIREKIKDKRGIATSCNNLGHIYNKRGHYQLALNYYKRALKIREEIQDKSAIAKSYSDIGTVYGALGDYAASIEFYLEALQIREEIGDKQGLADSYANMGYAHLNLGEPEKAISYFEKELKVRKDLEGEESYNVAKAYLNVGLAYGNMKEFEKSDEYYNISLVIFEKVESKRGKVLALANLGENLLKQEQYTEAEKYLLESLSISESINTNSLTSQILALLGELYYEKQDFINAKAYLERTVELTKRNGQISVLKNTLKFLTRVEEKNGNYQAALEAHKLYKQMSDSLFNKEKSKQIASLEIQYETEKKEQEIATLNQQAEIKDLELNRYTLLMTILGISLIVLILGGLVAYLVIRQQQLSLQQQAQNMEQKMLRAQMNPHFIFNAMAAIQDFMLQNNSKQAALYLSKFSKLIRQILDNSRSDYIRLEQEISMLENYLSLQNLRKQKPFAYQIEVSENLDVEEVAIPPMFAQPFIENAIEHGLDGSVEKGEIKITFDLKEDYILLLVQDNGIGIEKSTKVKKINPEKHESLATKITKERINIFRRSIKKDIAFEIQNLTQGTQVIFRLPYQFV